MNNLTNSESALGSFAKKIDFAKLEGKPEDFYKAGLALVENGQFDDGILEFVKVIKIYPPASETYKLALKELKSMGFNDEDILGINCAGIPINTSSESIGVASTEKKIDTSKLPGIIFIVIGLFFALLLFGDTNGLDFLNYCLPTFAFLALGFILLMLPRNKDKSQ